MALTEPQVRTYGFFTSTNSIMLVPVNPLPIVLAVLTNAPGTVSETQICRMRSSTLDLFHFVLNSPAMPTQK